MNTAMISGALFGRSDVARLLNIPPWTLANFADRRYSYGLSPSISGGKGRGKKSLYTLADVYKIATAHRMLIADQNPRVIADALRKLFPKNKDPMAIVVKERAVEWGDARCVLIDFGAGLWSFPAPDASDYITRPEWERNRPAKGPWIRLCSRGAISERIRLGTLRTFFTMPFDEMLNWVDSQILGREVSFARPAGTKKR